MIEPFKMNHKVGYKNEISRLVKYRVLSTLESVIIGIYEAFLCDHKQISQTLRLP